MTKLSVFFILTIAAIISSCSPQLSPFTQKMYEDNKWTDNDLRQIQFYLSQDIVLRRKVSDGETNIINGKIRSINGEKVEEIIFRRGTPCIYMFSPKSNRFAIGFEHADPSKYLIFGPNPKYKNRYSLFGKEWDRHSGTITYDGSSWYTTSESSFACLLVDIKRMNSLERKTQVVKGARIGN